MSVDCVKLKELEPFAEIFVFESFDIGKDKPAGVFGNISEELFDPELESKDIPDDLSGPEES